MTIVKTNVTNRIAKVSRSGIVIGSTTSPKIIGSSKTYKVSNAKIGAGMDITRFRMNQSVVETPNGVLKVFTLPNSEGYSTGLLEVFVDGLQQIKDTDYSETTAQTFTFTNAPDSDENIRINYIIQ